MNLWPSCSLWLPAAASAAELHRLGLVVLHSLWQAVAVAAVLAVALRILPRRSAAAVQARYLLAMLALLSLPVACVVTYAVIEPPLERGSADRAAMPRTEAGDHRGEPTMRFEGVGQAGQAVGRPANAHGFSCASHANMLSA